MTYEASDLTTYTKDQLVELLTTDIAVWNRLYQEARKASGYEWSASLHGASLHGASLHGARLNYASLHGAILNYASLNGASLNNAILNGKPITVETWCDLLDLPRCGKNLRIAYKRLPEDRITGRDQNNGKYLIEWKPGRRVEAPDWDNTEKCGGGLHLSPSPAATRTYSSEPLVIAVAFDPNDAVLLGDKIKVRKCKVVG